MMLRSNKMLWNRLKNLYNKEDDIENFGKIQFMRYIIFFGAPIDMTSKKSLVDVNKPGDKYMDLMDRNKEQQAYIDKF